MPITHLWVRLPTVLCFLQHFSKISVITMTISHSSRAILFRSFLYQRCSVEVSEVLVSFSSGLFSPLKLAIFWWNLLVHLRAEFLTEKGSETSKLELLTLFFLLVLSVGQSPPGQESSVAQKGKVRVDDKVITWPGITSAGVKLASELKEEKLIDEEFLMF